MDVCAKEIVPALVAAVTCFAASELVGMIPDDVVASHGLLELLVRFVKGERA